MSHDSANIGGLDGVDLVKTASFRKSDLIWNGLLFRSKYLYRKNGQGTCKYTSTL